MARHLHISQQNQTITVMKTSTLILSLSLLVLVSTTEAVSQPSFAFYYSSYGDQLSWNVPQAVMYKINRSYYGYDVVHVRQVPYRGFIDFEIILENRGTFLSVNIDHYGRILNSVQIVNSHFAHHICDSYCGFHANHYQRYYRPRPVVVANKYHYYNKGYGHGKDHHDKYHHNDHHYGNNNHQKGHKNGKYDNDHRDNNQYRDSQNGKSYEKNGRRDNHQNTGQGSSNDKYRGQASDSRVASAGSKTESTGYRRGLQTVKPATTETARQLSTRGN